MAFKQKGSIIGIDATKSGVSKAGKDYSTRTFRIGWSQGNYEQMLHFTTMKKELIEQLDRLGAGQDVEVSFDVTSREYDGKFYTEAKAFFIVSENMRAAPSTPAAEYVGTPPSDDLPF